MEADKAFTLLRWYHNPSVFFKEVFNLEPYVYQSKILNELRDLSIRRVLIMAAGGTGKTKLLAGLALWSTTALSKYLGKPYEVIIISGSQDQSRYLYEYCKEAIQYNIILSDLVKGEPLMTITRFKDNSIIRALPNSLKAIQGKHAHCVIVDEASIAGDFIIRDTLRIVSAHDPDRIILSGTPIDYYSLFVEMWEDDVKYNEWKRFHWDALECPITRKHLEEAKKMPIDHFNIFYLGKPYPMTNTLISPNLIKEASRDIQSFTYDSNGQSPIAGIDWGLRHPTVLVIIQQKDGIFRVLLDEEYRKQSPDTILEKITNNLKAYNVTTVYADSENQHENNRLLEKGFNVISIPFNREKTRMQVNLRMLFEQKKIKIPEEYVTLLWQLKKYTYDTKEDEDHVDALMLACKESPIIGDRIYFKISRPRRRTFPYLK